MTEQTLEQQLAGLSDDELLGLLNTVLAGRHDPLYPPTPEGDPMDPMPCPSCGIASLYCDLIPAPGRCCEACSGNHPNDTYETFYPPTPTRETR